jgi:hypothetical protein
MMRRRRFTCGGVRRLQAAALALTFGCALLRLLANGQAGPTPALRGHVRNNNGELVAGASVTLRKIRNRQPLFTLSDRGGAYAFADLAPGIDYELTAEFDGLVSRARPLRISSTGEHVAIDLILVAPIAFEDVAAQAGLNFSQRNGATGHFYQPEIMIAGVAVLDYNHDGCTDIFFANGATLPGLVKTGPEYSNRLYRNNCNLTFTDVTLQAGLAGQGFSMGVAAADYDNDGNVDLFVAGLHGNTLYRNRGDGTFEDVTGRAGLRMSEAESSKHWSVAAGWFDYDNDGWLDLFVSNYVEWTPELDPGCRLQGKPYYCHPRVFKGIPNQLFHNNRDGTFTDVSTKSGIARSTGKGMGVVFGDFNGDGLTDVFVANDSVPNFLFENLGNGTFKEVAAETGVAYAANGNAVAGMGADFRDLDDDGRDDIFLSAMYFDTFQFFRNRGKPHYFADETASSGLAKATYELTGWSVGACDFDNDGHKDLFAAVSHFPGSEPYAGSDAMLPNRVFLGREGATFEDVSRYAGRDFQRPALFHGAAFADFDNDGRVDVIVTAQNSPVRLFRNISPRSGHWIALRLEGTRSNRDGLGAWVRLTCADGRVEYNHAGTSVGYASSSEPLVRFGLGPYDSVKEVEIRWPGGRVQVLTAPQPDRVITVREPS